MYKLSILDSPVRFIFRLLVVFSALAASVVNAAPPTFSSVFSATSIGPGNESTLLYSISTDALDGVRNGQFTNTLPGDLLLATPANATSDCPFATLSGVNGGTVFSVSDIDMSTSSACSISVRVKAGTLATTYNNLTGDFTSDAGNSGTASASLTVDTSKPGYSLSFAPSAVTQGDTSTLTMDINNLIKTGSFDSVSGSIGLSSGLTVAAVPNVVTNCASSITITANSDSDSIVLGGFLSYPAAATTCNISVDVHAATLGELDASVGSLDWGSSGEIGQGSAQLTVSAAFALFEFDPVVVAPGSSTSLNITLSNRDRAISLSDIAFTDDLNAVITGLVATGLPLNDICGTGSSITGTSNLSFSGGSLTPETDCSFSVPVTLPVSAAPGTYINNSSVFTMNKDLVPANETAVSNALQVSAAPVLVMTFADTIAASGSTTTINYSVTNTDSGNTATDIEFTHNLGATFGGASIPVLPSPGFCGAGSFATPSVVVDEIILNVSGANLAAGLDCNFSVDIQLVAGTPGGDYATSTSSVSATISATSVAGPGATDNITIVDGPALTLELPQTAAAPGDQVTATFTLTKDSTAPSVSGIGFSLDLESALAGLTVSALPLGEVCGAGSTVTVVVGSGEQITFTGGILDVADSCTFDVDLLVPTTTESGTYSLITSNVTSTVLATPVTGSSVATDLDVTNLNGSMSFIGDPAAPGDAILLRFSFENTSTTQNLTDLVYTLNLGSVVSGMVATGLPVTDICGAGSSMSGTGFLIFAGGNLLSSTNCTFDISVTVPVGAATNFYNAVTSNLTFTENGTGKTISPLVDTLTVEVDEAPTVTISSALSPETGVTPIPVTITFNEDVLGFDVTDISGSVTNGTLSNFNAVSASVYTVDITPAASGTVTLQIPADSAQD